MSIKRIGRHLLEHHWRGGGGFFPKGGAAGGGAGQGGGGPPFRGSPLLGGGGVRRGAPLPQQSARERALDIFSRLRIWDTAHNNGVLIYLLLADRDFEIVADRGIDAKVGAAGWEKICMEMESDFKAENFERGVIKGIEAVSRLMG